MNVYQKFAMAREAAEAGLVATSRIDLVNARQISLYKALLHAPTSTLASNVSDRADVSSAAILGYN
ncbi:hypothetical protein [Paraburkholderia caffeinilytica]|uniref:Uncharacterized protein n=1 Tax=Paraburkholderia caffeinilytica TaxID=1761016 RepID=A0ABQ1LJT2_9BURK|nr:hypothetical protein [Paraburkholderia caffeinilytica]GGC23279.1 hypothetical protein GCM10011400_06970 [Paraburkholderia caffeinilytica]CAB3777144.1 hypothetical protein LMG28690_00369 [Paraburkholderia caffeinilytica]